MFSIIIITSSNKESICIWNEQYHQANERPVVHLMNWRIGSFEKYWLGYLLIYNITHNSFRLKLDGCYTWKDLLHLGQSANGVVLRDNLETKWDSVDSIVRRNEDIAPMSCKQLRKAVKLIEECVDSGISNMWKSHSMIDVFNFVLEVLKWKPIRRMEAKVWTIFNSTNIFFKYCSSQRLFKINKGYFGSSAFSCSGVTGNCVTIFFVTVKFSYQSLLLGMQLRPVSLIAAINSMNPFLYSGI